MKKSSGGDEPGKIFIGGLTRNTTKEMLDAEFCKYGEIIDSIVVKNMETGISRGFGFITYKDPNSVNSCLQKQIKIDGKVVEVKLCNTKLAAQQRQLKQNSDSCKLFIGGLPHNVSDDEIKQFFQRYGPVKEFKMMYDDIKKRPRGFGFITFESEESATQLLMEHYVSFKGKQIEVKPQIHNLKQHTPTNIGGYPANYEFWNLAAAAAIQPNAQAAQLAATQGSWSAQANANWGAAAGPYNYQSYNGQNPNQNWNYNYYGQAQGYYQTQADNAAIYDNQTTNAQLNNYDNYAITAGIHDPHHAAYYANPNASLLPAPLAAAVPPPPPPPSSGGVTGASAQQASAQQLQAKSYTPNYQNSQTTSTQRYQQNRNSGFVQSNGTNAGGIANLNNDSYQSTRQTQVTGYHPYRR